MQLGDVEAECSLPLQPEALAQVPRVLRQFMCVHGKISAEDGSFAVGWYPSADAWEFDERVPEDAFVFLSSDTQLGFVQGEQVRLVELDGEPRTVATPVSAVILQAMLER